MHETKDDLVLTVEVPGISEKDVTVSITGDLLTLKGERHWATEDVKDRTVLHVERVYGKFERLRPAANGGPGGQGEGDLPRRRARGEAARRRKRSSRTTIKIDIL